MTTLRTLSARFLLWLIRPALERWHQELLREQIVAMQRHQQATAWMHALQDAGFDVQQIGETAARRIH